MSPPPPLPLSLLLLPPPVAAVSRMYSASRIVRRVLAPTSNSWSLEISLERSTATGSSPRSPSSRSRCQRCSPAHPREPGYCPCWPNTTGRFRPGTGRRATRTRRHKAGSCTSATTGHPKAACPLNGPQAHKVALEPLFGDPAEARHGPRHPHPPPVTRAGEAHRVAAVGGTGGGACAVAGAGAGTAGAVATALWRIAEEQPRQRGAVDAVACAVLAVVGAASACIAVGTAADTQ